MKYSGMKRRDFITTAVAALAGTASAERTPPGSMGVPLRQEPLRFAFGELEPCFSAEGLRRHYMEHHAAYVRELRDNLAARQITVGNVTALMPGMEQITVPSRMNSRLPLGRLASPGSLELPENRVSPRMAGVIRQAGGAHVNHTAFWRFLCPPGSGPSGPQGRLARAIREDFGSVSTFRRVFKELAMRHPGSGWAWLVFRQDRALVATTTPNEDNPLMKEHIPWHQAGRPILALDLWEHSYLDRHGDDRESYIDAWWKVVNWKFVERAYEIASAMG